MLTMISLITKVYFGNVLLDLSLLPIHSNVRGFDMANETLPELH